MRILTFIKPIKTSILYPNEQRNEPFLINPYDAKVIDKLSAFKSRKDIELVCAAMGPAISDCVLYRAMASGIQAAYLLSDKSFAGADTVATSYVLGKGIGKIGADVVAMGEKAADGETGQTPHGLAERLGYKCISGVEEIISIQGSVLTVKCKMRGGYKIVKTDTPVILIFHGLTTIRASFTLVELKRAKAKGITVWSADDIGADRDFCGVKGSRTVVVNIKDDLVKKNGEIIEALPTEAAMIIMEILHGKDLCYQ